MRLKSLMAFVSAGVASWVLCGAGLAYASTKWARHDNSACEASSGFDVFWCPWVSSQAFDVGEVNQIIVDTWNFDDSIANVTVFVCRTTHAGSLFSCSSGFNSNIQLGSTPITINDSVSGGTTALNVWRNNSADYPFVYVQLNDTGAVNFKGFKVTN